MNKEWHLKNPMPKNPTFEERVKWNIEHEKYCKCRPASIKLLAEMKNRGLNFDSKISNAPFLKPGTQIIF